MISHLSDGSRVDASWRIRRSSHRSHGYSTRGGFVEIARAFPLDPVEPAPIGGRLRRPPSLVSWSARRSRPETMPPRAHDRPRRERSWQFGGSRPGARHEPCRTSAHTLRHLSDTIWRNEYETRIGRSLNCAVCRRVRRPGWNDGPAWSSWPSRLARSCGHDRPARSCWPYGPARRRWSDRCPRARWSHRGPGPDRRHKRPNSGPSPCPLDAVS